MDDEELNPILSIIGNGYWAGNTYAVTIRLSLVRPIIVERVVDGISVKFLHAHEVFEQSYTLTGPKEGMSSRIRESFITMTESLIVSSSKARQSIIRDIEKSEYDDYEKSRIKSIFE